MFADFAATLGPCHYDMSKVSNMQLYQLGPDIQQEFNSAPIKNPACPHYTIFTSVAALPTAARDMAYASEGPVDGKIDDWCAVRNRIASRKSSKLLRGEGPQPAQSTALAQLAKATDRGVSLQSSMNIDMVFKLRAMHANYLR